MKKYLSLIVLLTLVIFSTSSYLNAKERYSSPDLMEYYTSLRQPNSSTPCCGWGDAYAADKTESCPVGESDCALVAIITDTRPDTLVLPDGKVLTRPHIPVGTKFIIPKHKIRNPPVHNPTDHNIIFTDGTHVYCWEPLPGI